MKEIIYIGILLLNTLFSRFLGWWLTEVRRPLFPFKPFNCRPCFTFWLIILAGFAVISQYDGTLLNTAILCLLNTAYAFVTFFDIKSKFKINE